MPLGPAGVVAPAWAIFGLRLLEIAVQHWAPEPRLSGKEGLPCENLGKLLYKLETWEPRVESQCEALPAEAKEAPDYFLPFLICLGLLVLVSALLCLSLCLRRVRGESEDDGESANIVVQHRRRRGGKGVLQ